MSGEATAGLITAAQAASAQRQINFTRANEHEADRIGIETLSSAGFDPTGMSTFFEKLSRRYGNTRQQVPAILQTHPVTTERIADGKSTTAQATASSKRACGLYRRLRLKPLMRSLRLAWRTAATTPPIATAWR
jgi:predicted Zn-dependent protease